MTFQIPYRGNLPWLRDRTVLYVRHGSHAYGTNIASSDEDFKGVAIPPMEYFHGFLMSFAQAETRAHKDKKEAEKAERRHDGDVEQDTVVGEASDPDAVVYDVRKFFKLAADCNPNIIEVLWTDPSDHLVKTPLGQRLVDARRSFLSRKAKFTFSGYAVSQMKRINTHYRWLKSPPAAAPTRSEFGLPERTVIPADQLAAANAAVQKSVDRWEWKDLDTLDEALKIELKNAFSDRLLEITQWAWESQADKVWTCAARSIGYDTNFIELLDMERRYNARRKEWENYRRWLEKRNPQRAELEAKFGYDTKHGMHLVRLLTMAEEIMTTGEVHVRRKDRERLLSIRDGSWPYEKLVEWATAKDAELEALYEASSVLPKKPDRAKLDELCRDLVEESFR